ncbi:16870_t:CDS:2 [Dentiscutata heterogama]|uniref:16870_t:CDS:1 n=1 Tax=Dentiscutata heterogama TaxID=1316150 RepID=A0ACA9K2P8_9GLOM|nr:16870_t:CDS:2 [Dentiscutata heterogama]
MKYKENIKDFNKEKETLKTKSNKKKQILTLLRKKNFRDAFEIANSEKHITTWLGRGSEIKIDYIWVLKG